MKPMTRSLTLVCLLLCMGYPKLGHAQVAVYDAFNFGQNVIQAVQTIIMVGNQVLELTGLDEIVLGDDFRSDLNGLATIVKEAQGLSYDVSSLNAQVTALFDLDTAPNGTQDLRKRLYRIRRVVFDSYLYAMRTQTLLKTTLSTIQHLTRLVAAIESFAGNMQANQTLTQVNSTVTEQLAKMQVQTAAYERAQSIDRLTEALTIESLYHINVELLFDWPK